eukprot:2985598-Prymnesium_polylepis.2
MRLQLAQLRDALFIARALGNTKASLRPTPCARTPRPGPPSSPLPRGARRRYDPHPARTPRPVLLRLESTRTLRPPSRPSSTLLCSLPVSLSPCLPVSLSPCLSCLPVSLSPCLPVSLSVLSDSVTAGRPRCSARWQAARSCCRVPCARASSASGPSMAAAPIGKYGPIMAPSMQVWRKYGPSMTHVWPKYDSRTPCAPTRTRRPPAPRNIWLLCSPRIPTTRPAVQVATCAPPPPPAQPPPPLRARAAATSRRVAAPATTRPSRCRTLAPSTTTSTLSGCSRRRTRIAR